MPKSAERHSSGEDLLSISQACQLLKCHPNTLRKWDKTGVLPSIRMGERGHRRYRREDIENFLQSNNLLRKTKKLYTDLGDDSQLGKRTPEDLKSLLMALSDTALVSETNRRGDITYANHKFVEISKYPLEELLGQNHRILKSEHHPPEFYRSLWRTISKGRVWRGRIKNKAKDGTYYWVDTSIAPILNEKGQPVRYISVRFPITEQMELQEKLEGLNAELEERIKRRTEELYRSQERLRDLTNSMPQLVWTALPDGTIDYYNDKHKEYEGIEKKVNKFVWKPVVHPDHVQRTLNAWNMAVETGTVYEVEHMVKMKTGEYVWHLSRGVPVKDENGNVIKWYGTATDINKQKVLEQMKDEFLGVASHELKTPVTSLKAYNQIMKAIFKRKDDKTSVELLEKMESQINKLTALITDLLDVTRMQSGKLQLRLEHFDFNELVENIVDEMQMTTDRHTITKELDISINAFGDRERLGQVVVNFLSNAIKFSPNSDKIIVSTVYEPSKVTLCVQDFGVGLPPGTMDKIFERFYRVHGANQNTFPGLGLGLYISSQIVNRHNGQIWAISEEGKGSTFCFSIPLKHY